MNEVVALERVVDLARGVGRIAVLTGAGMSAESGVPTFRDAQTGLWARFEPSELATPEAWAADPALVWSWYQWRRRLVTDCLPNAGHLALARWAEAADVRIATQNVDDLHERAGSEVLTHLHGSLFAFRCDTCGAAADPPPLPAESEPDVRTQPPACSCGAGRIRPGVVWFGEALPEGAFDAAMSAVLDSELVVAIGTSGIVQPAALLPGIALRAGIPVVEINVTPTALSESATVSWLVPAALGLPALVARL